MNTTEDKPERCCFCNVEMPTVHDSNNALPVKMGRCCHKCNRDFVIPERIKSIYGYYM